MLLRETLTFTGAHPDLEKAVARDRDRRSPQRGVMPDQISRNSRAIGPAALPALTGGCSSLSKLPRQKLDRLHWYFFGFSCSSSPRLPMAISLHSIRIIRGINGSCTGTGATPVFAASYCDISVVKHENFFPLSYSTPTRNETTAEAATEVSD